MPKVLPLYDQHHIRYAIGEMSKNVVSNLKIMQAQGNTGSDEYREAEQKARESMARMLKYYEYSLMSPNKSLYDELTPEKKAELDQQADSVKFNKDVIELFNEDNLENTMKIMSDDGQTPREPDDIVFKMETGNRIKLATKAQQEQEERHRASLLTDFLEKTGSKSFTGKLKSWFVGNSKEYKNAIKSLKDFSKNEATKDEAIKNIKAYLDIRRDKVRDHQYGRDRFQGFMESLQTLMEPAEFKEYCAEVGKARNERDKNYDPNQVQPEQFAPTAERGVLKGLLENERTVEQERAAIETAAREDNKKKLQDYAKDAEQVFADL